MDLSKTLKTIRGLYAKAESLEAMGSPDNIKEADTYRAKADGLMQQYAVEEWQLLNVAATGLKPSKIRIEIGMWDSPFRDETATLVYIVAKFCKCASIQIMDSGKYRGTEDWCEVYGYESDLRYFELLYTSLFLHMSGAIFPKPNPALSLGENAYILHNAGMNWFDIAKAYGWREVTSRPGEAKYMYVNESLHPGERISWAKSIGRIKAAYVAEIARRGEVFFRIPPSGSETFRRNAAQGYLTQIRSRLTKMAGERGAGTELVLRDKTQNVADMLAAEHPDKKASGTKNLRYNHDAYQLGVRHANMADLNPAAGSPRRGAIS